MLIPAVREDLCLTYANTLSWRGSETSTEELHSIADLLGWLERTAGWSAGAVRDLRQWSREYERKAAAVFTEAIAVREAIFRAFSDLATGRPMGQQDFTVIGDMLAAAPARTRLVRTSGGYAWQIAEPRPSVPHLLAPVLWSAADLILNAPQRRIRRCANDKCLWLFLDKSKSGTRRWCDMSACGNRAKAQRHYLKSKGS